jgi:hypothetical protein
MAQPAHTDGQGAGRTDVATGRYGQNKFSHLSKKAVGAGEVVWGLGISPNALMTCLPVTRFPNYRLPCLP